MRERDNILGKCWRAQNSQNYEMKFWSFEYFDNELSNYEEKSQFLGIESGNTEIQSRIYEKSQNFEIKIKKSFR